MYNEINNKTNEIITIFKNSNYIKEMQELKQNLINNKKIKNLLDEYITNLKNPYSNECIKIKQELLGNSEFKKYKDMEEHLIFLLLKINQKLKSITLEKSCGK